jgi:DNA-binding XRE family transcriptional regulator
VIKLGSCEKKKMTQQKLGAMVSVSYRTIRSWEVEGRYPKQSSLYQKLADALQCRGSYLMNDNETVCLGNDEPSEYSGAKQARKILEQAAALFASGTMNNEDRTYNSVNDPEKIALEIELFVPVVRV